MIILEEKMQNKNATVKLLSPWVRFIKRMMLRRFSAFARGCITWECSGYSLQFGNANAKLRARVRIVDVRFYRMLVFRGELGFFDAYLKDYIEIDDLTSLLSIFAANIVCANAFEAGAAKIHQWCQYLYYHIYQKNSPSGSKKNIALHYDLGNKLFQLFLDKNKQYSSALFLTDQMSLDEAQCAKMHEICQRLQLSEHDKVLEIGSGWGGLATYIAREYGCHVTTITLSQQQYEYVAQLIQQEQLGDLVNVKLMDYRSLEGKFDKIVSVEMIEAVGHKYFQNYFDVCSKVLAPKGLFLMQAILIGDDEYRRYKHSVDFIRRYIFPGGLLPCINVLNACANRANFKLRAYSDMTASYVKTLLEWQRRFNNKSESLMQLGYDQYFQKVWNIYFSYCQAGFVSNHIRTAHLLFEKRE
jgi:cyclopropane-fatty-acyl-phospholipid synthase